MKVSVDTSIILGINFHVIKFDCYLYCSLTLHENRAGANEINFHNEYDLILKVKKERAENKRTDAVPKFHAMLTFREIKGKRASTVP